MLASRVDAEEALRIGWIDDIVKDKEEFEKASSRVIDTVLTTGPVAVYESKKLTLELDRWTGSDEDLRLWTLEKTSEMRGSREGQEGLSAFLERRSPDWSTE